jgi:uncharacterized protein (DUF1786 family)
MTLPTILAMDIGGGTQDILVYDPNEPIENAPKLVLPSPTRLAAARIRRVTEAGKPLFLAGRVMGGGAVSRAVGEHLKAGLAVFSLPDPAKTIHDNLDKVASKGVTIVDRAPGGDAEEVRLGDLDLVALREVLARYEVPFPEHIALAIQDHGYSPGYSNRLTRFQQWQAFLDAGGDVGDLLFDRPPETLTRWLAAEADAPRAWFMDTAAAALRGAILDEEAAKGLADGLVVVNAGNEHTVAFLVRGRTVFGVYEHHTSLVDPEKLADHLDRFSRGILTNQEIFDQWGHGVAYRDAYRAEGPFETIVVTGPQRALAKDLGRQAAPYGEMMLSGCFGLVAAASEAARD